MHSIVPEPSPTQAQARPSVCPNCGLMADNGIVVESELTRTATYVDTAGHMWSVMWSAVA